MTSSGVSYNFTASFIISSVESPSFIFEKKYAPVELIPSTYGTRTRAGGHQEIFIADFRKNYAGNNGIFHDKSPFFRTILRLYAVSGKRRIPDRFAGFSGTIWQIRYRRGFSGAKPVFSAFFLRYDRQFLLPVRYCSQKGTGKRLFQRIRERSDV